MGGGGILAMPGLLLQTIRYEYFAENSLVSTIGYIALGINFTAARLVSAVLGTLTIYVAYRAGKALSGARLGLIFSFLLAIEPWHVQISRYGDSEHVLSPLQFLLALWLLAEALDGGRLFHYVCAALALGLGWVVYSPNQAGLLVLALFALYKVASRPSILRRDTWRPAVAFAVLLFLSSTPIRSFVQNGRVYPNFRTGYDGERPVLGAERVRTMTAMAAGQLFVSADDPWFGKPGGGLGFVEEALFLPGVLLALGGLFLKRRRDLAVLVVLGLPISLVPGILAPDPSFRRFFLTATIILLMAAAVLDEGAGAARGAGITPRVLGGIAALAGLLCAALNAYAYFRVVHVDTEESCRFPFVMTNLARPLLGKEFVFVVVPDPGEETSPVLQVRRARRARTAEREGAGGRRAVRARHVPECLLPSRRAAAHRRQMPPSGRRGNRAGATEILRRP